MKALSDGQLLVQDLPAHQCPVCGNIYLSVALCALIERLARGKQGVITMAEIEYMAKTADENGLGGL